MSLKIVDVGEHLSAREAGLRFTSELQCLHKLPHRSLTQYLPMSCSDPLTNVRDNVCIKSLSWMLKPMSLLYCLLQTTLPKRTVPALQPMCSCFLSCDSSAVPSSTKFTGHGHVQSTSSISFLCECQGRTEEMSPWEMVSHFSPESQGHLGT